MHHIETVVIGESEVIAAAKVMPTVCEYMPESIAYLVKKTASNAVLTGDDWDCLREVTKYYQVPGGVQGFLRVYGMKVQQMERLLRKSKLLMDTGDDSATQALMDCMEMLIEWEFLRSNEVVRVLDEMLSRSLVNGRNIGKWRRKMIGFEFKYERPEKRSALRLNEALQFSHA